MNRRMIFNAIGVVLQVEAVLLLLPAIVSLIYAESSFSSYLISAVLCFAVGILPKFWKPRTRTIYAKEGFIIVSFTWILLSLFGCLPFILSGEIPNFFDAFFETVSGFTTTGASILTDVESLSHGAQLWRSFTHWIGGMGIIVFVMAIMPNVSERPMHILRAEMPGPIIGKLVPRVKDTAKILYLIYIAMTVLQMLLMCFGGMPLFKSCVYAFATAGTGGFTIDNTGLSAYSPYLQWVITIFMLLFSLNFNLYYLLLVKRFKEVFKSRELWAFIGIVAVSVGLIAINISSQYGSFSETLRQSAFQISSVISTTGYASTDTNLWPTFSKGILFLLMFIGGCAGSTAGGIKVSRIVMLFKLVSKEIRHMLHPRSVSSLRYEGRVIDTATTKNVGNYFLIYFLCFFVIFLLVSIEPVSFETSISATAACFNNVGPGFDVVGAMGNYSSFSNFTKFVLSFAMLLGRLEIFPLIITASLPLLPKNK